MLRIWIAFSAFFSLLFLGRLPRQAARYLVPEAPPLASEDAAGPGEVEQVEAQPTKPMPAPSVAPSLAPPVPEVPAKTGRASNEAALRTEGALVLLTLLQREGRLLDFLRESLDSYDDASVGVAVRNVHRDCRKVLDAHIKVEPVMVGKEDETVSVPKGFDPSEVRVIGSAAGDPPWRGVLLHHGWRVIDAKLPMLAGDVDRNVIAPAEVKLD